ncbi:hypothetical protein RHS03_06688, partial [Rhizoctonia solani]
MLDTTSRQTKLTNNTRLSERSLRTNPRRSKRAEQNDKAMATLNLRRETSVRRSNVRQQYKALSRSQLGPGSEDDADKSDELSAYDDEDGTDEQKNPTAAKLTKTKSGVSTSKKSGATSTAQGVPAAIKHSLHQNASVQDENALKSELIARIAMRDRRADHFSFTLKKLKTIWENGKTRSTAAQACATQDDKLQDMGTVDADEPSKAKGPMLARKVTKLNGNGDQTGRSPGLPKVYTQSNRATGSFQRIQKPSASKTYQNPARASSISTVLSARSSSPNFSRASLPSVVSSRASSRYLSLPPPKQQKTPATSNPHRSTSLKQPNKFAPTKGTVDKPRGSQKLSSNVVHTGSNANIQWDVDSAEEEEEYRAIDQDQDETLYNLGETSCDEGKPKKTGKSKSSDYQGPARDILDATLDKVFAVLLATGFFMDPMELDVLIARTWRYCANKLVNDPSLNCHCLSLNKLRAIKYRISGWQGKLKDAIKAKIHVAYDLQGSQSQVKQTAGGLLPHEFHRRPGAKPRTGHYEHPFLQTACNSTIFTKRLGKPPIAVKFSKMFTEMPLATIALICAMIHFLLKTLCTGEEYEKIVVRNMTEKFYLDHLQSLQNLEKVDPDAICRIRVGMFQRGIEQVPVKVSAAPEPTSNLSSGVLSIADIVCSKPKHVGEDTEEYEDPAPVQPKHQIVHDSEEEDDVGGSELEGGEQEGKREGGRKMEGQGGGEGDGERSEGEGEGVDNVEQGGMGDGEEDEDEGKGEGEVVGKGKGKGRSKGGSGRGSRGRGAGKGKGEGKGARESVLMKGKGVPLSGMPDEDGRHARRTTRTTKSQTVFNPTPGTTHQLDIPPLSSSTKRQTRPKMRPPPFPAPVADNAPESETEQRETRDGTRRRGCQEEIGPQGDSVRRSLRKRKDQEQDRAQSKEATNGRKRKGCGSTDNGASESTGSPKQKQRRCTTAKA